MPGHFPQFSHTKHVVSLSCHHRRFRYGVEARYLQQPRDCANQRAIVHNVSILQALRVPSVRSPYGIPLMPSRIHAFPSLLTQYEGVAGVRRPALTVTI